MQRLAPSRLRELARASGDRATPVAAASTEDERCELCGAPIDASHRHVRDLDSGAVRCTCRACSLLFDREGAGAGRLRLIPDRRLRLVDFALSDQAWERLRIPVEMAFFFYGGEDRRVKAFYPSPMGATESMLGLEAWRELERANPILRELERDVEALLVDRAKGSRRHWIVPIDECYALVGLIRTRWRGLSGGREVWTAIGGFFEELDRRSKPVLTTDAQRQAESAETLRVGAAERS